MDEEVAILSAIAAHPDEDTPRLAYADWLDDSAADLPEPDAARIRAEFIRVQCEIRKYQHLTSAQQQRYIDLYRRQDAILTRHRHDLLGPLGDELNAIEMQRDVVFDRGFVSEIQLEAERFFAHFSTLRRLKPLPRIRLVEIGGPQFPNLLQRPELELVNAMSVPTDVLDVPFAPYEVAVNIALSPYLKRLQSLDLEGCQIGDDGLGGIARSPYLRGLEHLDLSGNNISDSGVLALVTSPLWPRLKSLVLGANPISDEGAFALADAPPTAIEYLNLRFTGIGRVGQQRLLRRKGWKVDLF